MSPLSVRVGTSPLTLVREIALCVSFKVGFEFELHFFKL